MGQLPLSRLFGALSKGAKGDRLPQRQSVVSFLGLITGAGEIAMNAVVHGSGGEARLCSLPGQRLQMWIEDQGSGMARGTLHRATLEKGYTTADTMG